MLVVFVISGAGYALVVIDGPKQAGLGLATVFLVSVPWSVFAVRYAGRGYLIGWGRVTVLAAAALATSAVLSAPDVPGLPVEAVPEGVQLANQFVLLGLIAVVFVVSGLVVLAAYRHASLSSVSGAVAVLPIAELLFAGQLTNSSVPVFSSNVLTASYVAFAVTVVLSVTRFDILSLRPGTGTLGERRVVEEMDEAVFVVGRRGDIARSNDTAERLFGPETAGEQFADVFDCPVEGLSGQGIIERWTERGRMRFDPRVSRLTDPKGRTLGHTVTLLDVTDREIRRQRIQVLILTAITT